MRGSEVLKKIQTEVRSYGPNARLFSSQRLRAIAGDQAANAYSPVVAQRSLQICREAFIHRGSAYPGSLVSHTAHCLEVDGYMNLQMMQTILFVIFVTLQALY